MSDHIGPVVDAEVARRAERHPYAGHPAALVLAGHEVAYWTCHGAVAHCTCGAVIDCTGDTAGHAAHLAEVLHRAGLLADGPPPVTLTERILAERANGRTT